MFDYGLFIFEEHCAVFFSKNLLALLPTEFRESLIFQLFVLGCEDGMRARTIFISIAIISAYLQ